MSQPSSYMDDVPVRISEKYKPPPRVILPASVSQTITTAKHLVDSLDYDFSLETNILKKLEEIRLLKESQENERKLRLQQLAEERQKQLDLLAAAAAAEAEEKLKQLSVSEVSYPSTDESSEISPDDAGDREDTFSAVQNHQNQMNSDTTITSPLENVDSPKCASPFYPANEKSNEQDNILKPTLISSFGNYNLTSLMDDPDPIKGMQQNVDKYSVLKMVNIRNNVENLTYSDFEHDTSSPFDNMELKTINEMEMLAQVLNTQQSGMCEYKNDAAAAASDLSNTNHINDQDKYVGYYNANNSSLSYQIPAAAPTTYFNNTETLPNHTASVHTLPGSYPISNGLLASNTEPVNNPNANIPNGYYDPMYSYYQNNYQSPQNTTYGLGNDLNYSTSDYFNNRIEENPTNSCSAYLQRDSDSYSSYNYNYHDTKSSDYSVCVPPRDETTPIGRDGAIVGQENDASLKTRSRSVPDIIRELDEEITSARIRMKERSYNASPAHNLSQTTVEEKTSVAVASSSEQNSIKDNLQRPFKSLPGDLQTLCKYISSMGFPLERVARACRTVGSNDKKVIEYLLTMGELMDLGFSEGQVATALVENDFNRDKALDDLVS